MSTTSKTRIIDYLLVLSIIASVVLGTIAFLDLGIYTSLYGIRISSRTLFRPAIVAAVASLLWLYRSEARQRSVAALLAASLHHAKAVAVFLAIFTFVIAFRISHFEAAGADSYGYVSQAQLWVAGNLIKHEPLAAIAPWPDPEWTLSPLGYRPGPRPATIVPTYAPGLPLVMAGLLKVFGSFGPFLAVPLLGSVAIFTAFLLGQHVAGNACGLITAALLLTSPIFLFQLKEPMNDVPITAWWLLAIVLVARATPLFLLAGGLATTAAILTRPNLAPLAAILGIFILSYSAAHFRARIWNAVVFSLSVIPGCIGVAILNTKLYGSPLSSGYGDMSGLFNVDYFWPNLSRYSRWLIESETPFILFAALGFVLLRRRERQPVHTTNSVVGQRLSTLFVAFVVILYACYVFYLPFDNWTYVRFLLPGIPLLLILCSISVLYLSAKLPSLFTKFVLAVCLIVFLLWRWEVTGLKPLRPHDRRVAVIAEYVRNEVPENAIIFSMIHSGSIRYYSGRLTLRWDWLPAEWLERSLAFLSANGYHPFLLIEDWERPQFIERFAGQTRWGALDWPPVATYRGNPRADLFDLTERANITPRRIGSVATAAGTRLGRQRRN